MTIRIKRESLVLKSYYIGIFLLIFRFVIASSYLNTEWMSFLSYIGLFLEVFHIFFTKHSPKFMALFFVCVLLGTIAYNHTQSLTILYFFIIVFASYNIDYTRYLKTMYHSIIVSIGVIAFCSIIGIAPLINNDGFLTFGFSGKNGLCILLVTILVIYAFLYYEKKSTKRNLNIWFLFIIIGLWLQGKTSLFSGFIALFCLTFCARKSCIFNRRILYIFIVVFVVLSSFLFYRTMYFGDNGFDWVINKVLTGRLLQANYYYKWYGFTTYGSVLKEFQDESHYFLDFGYMNMIIQNGYIYFVVNIIAYLWALINSLKNNNIKITILVLYVLFMLIGENIFCNPFINPVYPILAFFFSGKIKHSKNRNIYGGHVYD